MKTLTKLTMLLLLTLMSIFIISCDKEPEGPGGISFIGFNVARLNTEVNQRDVNSVIPVNYIRPINTTTEISPENLTNTVIDKNSMTYYAVTGQKAFLQIVLKNPNGHALDAVLLNDNTHLGTLNLASTGSKDDTIILDLGTYDTAKTETITLTAVRYSTFSGEDIIVDINQTINIVIRDWVTVDFYSTDSSIANNKIKSVEVVQDMPIVEFPEVSETSLVLDWTIDGNSFDKSTKLTENIILTAEVATIYFPVNATGVNQTYRFTPDKTSDIFEFKDQPSYVTDVSGNNFTINAVSGSNSKEEFTIIKRDSVTQEVFEYDIEIELVSIIEYITYGQQAGKLDQLMGFSENISNDLLLNKDIFKYIRDILGEFEISIFTFSQHTQFTKVYIPENVWIVPLISYDEQDNKTIKPFFDDLDLLESVSFEKLQVNVNEYRNGAYNSIETKIVEIGDTDGDIPIEYLFNETMIARLSEIDHNLVLSGDRTTVIGLK